MNSIRFPKIFEGNSTKIVEDKQSTFECLRLLLGTTCGELTGDPDFGTRIKRYTFEQNNYVLKNIIIDEIYDKICIFCPQISLTRNDITITQDGAKMGIHIKAINKIDFTTDTYDLALFATED